MKVNFRLVRMIGFTEILMVTTCVTAVLLTYSFYSGRMLPNTTINGIAVGGLSIEEAAPGLSEIAKQAPQRDTTLSVDDIVIASGSGELGLHYDYDHALHQAFARGKSGNVVGRFLAIIGAVFSPYQAEATLAFDPDKLVPFVTELKLRADIVGEHPHALLGKSGVAQSLEVSPGEPGRMVELDNTIAHIQNQVKLEKFSISAQVASTSARLTDEQIIAAKARALDLVGTQIIFVDNDDRSIKRTLVDQSIIESLVFPAGFNETELRTTVDEWAKTLSRPAQPAIFEYDPKSMVVSKFVPDRDGVELSIEQTIESMRAALKELETMDNQSSPRELTKELVLSKTKPAKTLAETNSLGINQRIGYGESAYAHSIPNRIHNVQITTDRVSNVIIPAGAEFSFNKALGEVSARTGYRSAYVIRNGRTELGDGGGVCQVSSTVFRAALNAGLPITKRIPHSYRVSYYELDSKPGVDATVYSGNIDLRFMNDTGHAVLLHAEADSKNLTMFVEMYGTSDGRIAEITDHVTWDYRGAPPAEFYPDPTLPPGVKKQIDWAAAGIKAKFKNIVKDKSGKVVREEEYVSNYKPWSAKYLVGM